MTTADLANLYRLNVDEIQRFLPHRPPFLMVDRVLEIHPTGRLDDFSPTNMIGIRVVASKCISMNEPHFQGHFPGFAIMPGVLILEAMAQTSSFSLYPYVKDNLARFTSDFQCILVGIDEVRFRKPVVPGDTLVIETKVARCRGRIWYFDCMATVEGQKVAEAKVLANLVSSYFNVPGGSS